MRQTGALQSVAQEQFPLLPLETSEAMSPNSVAYLQHLEQLICELSNGMDAIASNSVDRLKQSIASQEALCAGIAATSVADGLRMRHLSQSAVPPAQNGIELTIWKAGNTIRQLNMQYDALLKRSGKNASLFAALCDNHIGRATEQQGLWAKRQTWSCEM